MPSARLRARRIKLQRVAQQRVTPLDCVDIRQPLCNAAQGRHFHRRHGRRFVRRNAIGFRRHHNNRPWRLLGDWRRRKPASLIAHRLTARRRHRARTAQPRHVHRRIVGRGLARQQIAPGFDRGPGFPDVFQKGRFAVKAAPTAGLEQLGEIFQPPLGKRAPARDDVAAMCHAGSMYHETARKEKNGRRRNRNESIRRDGDILWKTLILSSAHLYQQLATAEGRRSPGFSFLSTVKRRAGMAALRGRRRLLVAAADMRRCEISPETKDPSGGTTGRVKLYGRLGWMGARAKYSLVGEGLPLPPI